ncbi:MAG: hypothetical protein KDF61_02685, partial [Rhodocyclaceae bacterium]|nr:hypothetical protein [Rhodocyclaceae bacterium]
GVAKHPDGDALLKSHCARVRLSCACCCLKRSFEGQFTLGGLFSDILSSFGKGKTNDAVRSCGVLGSHGLFGKCSELRLREGVEPSRDGNLCFG